MVTLEETLVVIKEQVSELMHVVYSQIEKSQTALLTLDKDLSNEIRHIENRVNAQELSIDKNCEYALALQNPLAVDLRFILSVMKINSQLERIADHADAVAIYVYKDLIKNEFDEKLLEEVGVNKMYEVALRMLNDVIEAFTQEDSTLARSVFVLDEQLNAINVETNGYIAAYMKKNPKRIQDCLFLQSIMKKIERVGDLTKNIAEEIIFYMEAKVLKHKTKAR